MSLATEVAGKLNYLNDKDKATVNALAPYSGYLSVQKKMDTFVFKEDAGFTYKMADKNRFLKFGDTVVDTYGPELVNVSNIVSISDSIVSIIDNKVDTTSSSTSANNCEVLLSTPLSNGESVVFSLETRSSSETYCDLRWGGVYDSTEVEYLNSTVAGSFKGLFTNTSGVDVTSVLISSGGVSRSIDGISISIRKIQTADFTNTTPDVTEIITDGSNTTSLAVAKGEFVLDGNILDTNGDFSNGTDGWLTSLRGEEDTGDSATTLVATNGGVSGAGYLVHRSGLVGIKIRITYEIKSYTSGTLYTCFGSGGFGGGKLLLSSTEIGTHTVVATTNQNGDVGLYTPGFVGVIDNLSIERVSDVFRAKQDAPVGTALTNTTYFEDRTQLGVTNQALMAHKYNTSTNSYEGLHTEVLFNDVAKEQLLDNSIWMANNGFSKVSQFLYSKGDSLYLPVGVVQC